MKINELFCRLGCFGIALVVAACSGGVLGTGDGSGEDGGTNGGTIENAAFQGQALLGSVVGATANVQTFSTLEVNCTDITQDSGDLTQAGLFSIPAECIESSTLFNVTVSGGVNTDVDNDLSVDAVPTLINGSFSAVLTAEEIRSEAWNITAVTDITARLIKFLQEKGLSESRIMATIDIIAPSILKEDLTADGVINGRDILAWNPQLHEVALQNPALIEQIIHQIEQGISTSDISTTGQLFGQLSIEGSARIIRVKDDVAFVVSSDNTRISQLSMIDVSNSTSPSQIGHYSTQQITDMVVGENYVYLALGEKGLEVIDISDMAEPKRIGVSKVKVDQLALENDVLIAVSVAAEQTLVHSINISNPYIPEFVANMALDSGTYVSALRVVNEQALLSIVDWQSLDSHLYVIDVSNPNLFSVIQSELVDSLTISDISITDTKAYLSALFPNYLTPDSSEGLIATDKADLFVIDLLTLNGAADENNESKLNSLTGEGMDVSSGHPTGSIEVDASKLYSYFSGAITVRNLSGKDVINQIELPEIFESPVGPDVDFTVVGNKAYIAHRQYGLLIVQLLP